MAERSGVDLEKWACIYSPTAELNRDVPIVSCLFIALQCRQSFAILEASALDNKREKGWWLHGSAYCIIE